MCNSKRLLAGASGYSYKEWKGVFYSQDMKPDGMLAWYAERLPTVEINNTFYRMPGAAMLENWARATPEGFRFAIKASGASRTSPASRRKPRPIPWITSTARSPPWVRSAARSCSSFRRR